MEITTIGMDLAKSVFAVTAADRPGKVVQRKQLRRNQVLGFLRAQKRCVVGMEACGSAHHWARQLAQLGHEVRLMSPALVKPYRKGSKHDRNDADAVLEAVSRPTMRFVAVKSVAQQDLLALHRVRTRLLKQRVALSNQIRALLYERGVALAKGAKALYAGVAAALAEEHHEELSGMLRSLVVELMEELRGLQARLEDFDRRISRAARRDERCVRLQEVPGVGPLTATALVATVGNAREFHSGRELSAYLGLTPRQHSSGGKTVMLGISKHGNRYLRTLLIHGARSLMRRKNPTPHPRAQWAARLAAARGTNLATVALANHNARVLWALLSRGERYRGAVPGAQFSAAHPPTAVERVRGEKLLVVKPT